MTNQTFASVFDALCNTPAEAADMHLRANLMMHITTTIQENGWTQKQAAEHLPAPPKKNRIYI